MPAESERSYACRRRAWWVGYDTENRPENLTGDEFMRKGQAFFAYSAAVLNETTANAVGWNQPDAADPVCGGGARGRLPVDAASRERIPHWPY